MSTFTNWAGNQQCEPASWLTPTSVDQVAEIVAAATARGQRVKVVGAGHSFTDAACTGGVLLSLDALAKVEDHDPASHQITVGAGIRLRLLNDELHARGLAMPNLGDIDAQSLAGATATATHGTGASHPNLSAAIVGFEVVTAAGEVRWCGEAAGSTEATGTSEADSELFAVGRVSIGALGVITRIRLQCVPSFVLHATETVEAVADVMADWSGFVASADHAELFMVPGGANGFVLRRSVSDQPEQPRSRLRHFIEKELTENVALDVMMRIVRRFPQQRDRLAGLLEASASDRQVVDRSYRVFASPRRVRFVEMEYGLPVAALPEALERVQALVATLDRPPLFPIEVRVSAADDIALSTGEGRASGWIAVHQYRGIPFDDYFRGVETIMNDYEGRPHWGKFHYQIHDVLAERYPQWERFAAVRAEVDPSGTFRNDYLDRVLGPIGASTS